MRRFLLFLLLTVLSVNNVSAQNDSLPVRLSTYDIDLGERAGRAVIDTAVWVKNVGDVPQKYFTYRSSCDCLKVLAEKYLIINPGDSVRFPIRYDIGRYYAQHEYIKHIRLDFGNGVRQTLKITFYIGDRNKDANKEE